MVDIVRAYKDPEKHAQELDMDRIVADEKVDREGVERYARMFKEGEEVKPIIVVKHPKDHEYAVLNGHHRFWACKKLGMEKIRAVVVEDMLGLGFHLTKRGVLQPSKEVTRHVRIPAKRFRRYMQEFLKDPKGMLREQLELYRK